jgi:hypothetical protein
MMEASLPVHDAGFSKPRVGFRPSFIGFSRIPMFPPSYNGSNPAEMIFLGKSPSKTHDIPLTFQLVAGDANRAAGCSRIFEIWPRQRTTAAASREICCGQKKACPPNDLAGATRNDAVDGFHLVQNSSL